MKSVLTLIASALVAFVSKGQAMEKSLPANAKEAITKNAVVVVDVRELSELSEGMIAGAQRMPMSQVDSNSELYQKWLKELPKDKEIWLYCRSGRRSGLVADKLQALGYKAKNIGGFTEVKDTGAPVTK